MPKAKPVIQTLWGVQERVFGYWSWWQVPNEPVVLHSLESTARRDMEYILAHHAVEPANLRVAKLEYECEVE